MAGSATRVGLRRGSTRKGGTVSPGKNYFPHATDIPHFHAAGGGGE